MEQDLKKQITKYIIAVPALILAVYFSWKLIKICSPRPRGEYVAYLVYALWGLFVLHQLKPFWEKAFGRFYPLGKAKGKLTPELKIEISTMIMNSQSQKAVEKLNSILRKVNYQPEATLMLAQIYENNLGNPRMALDIIEDYFSQEKVHPLDENIEMLLLHANISSKLSLHDKSQGLLSFEIKRKGYSESQLQRLNSCLEEVNNSISEQ